jgi:hypothetical protein
MAYKPTLRFGKRLPQSRTDHRSAADAATTAASKAQKVKGREPHRADETLLDVVVTTLASIAAREQGDCAAVQVVPVVEIEPNGPADAKRPGNRKWESNARSIHRDRSDGAVDVDDQLASFDSSSSADLLPDGSQRPLILHEIASFLNVSENVARYLLRTKKLRGFKAGGQWRAMPQAITEYIIEQLSKR